MLLVEANVPELLVEMGYGKSWPPHTQAIGDLLLIALFYLLCIGEYTVKGKRNNIKETMQFKLKNVTFFKKNKGGDLGMPLKNGPGKPSHVGQQCNAKA